MDIYRKIKILRIRDNSYEETDDLVAVEKRLRISVNNRNVLNLYCTPSMVRELVAGIIHNEGLISGDWCADRIAIEFGEEIIADVPSSGTFKKGEGTITSGCAGGVSFSGKNHGTAVSDGSSFDLNSVMRVYKEFQGKSELFRTTGGVHSAAISDRENIIAFAEDIGRHNAVDKVIGYFILENMPFAGKIMLVSGRLSSDIVLKCSRAGIPFLVSRAAPTSLAVEIAESAGITLAGFARSGRINIYTARDRVIL